MRIEEYSAEELLDLLNGMDETSVLEAKSLGEDSVHSIMETVCSFSNEPGLGGGVILIGVAENKEAISPRYKVDGVPDPDKAQLDLASQCASMFNIPVRPEISVETVDGKIVLKVFVRELTAGRKPLYFKKDGIPAGIWRRIGSSDQRCSEEELPVFYNREDAVDAQDVDGAKISDVDEDAVERYRYLRKEVNPAAVELAYDTPRLLKALGCVNRSEPTQLNLAGVLMFGSKELQRSVIPAARVDYIRVPGTRWVEDPEASFASQDMRGPLIPLVFRVIDAIRSDLPTGFLLREGDVQAKSIGLPVRALREAIVNALMHRSYRINRPTQIIRYDNRIEIINAGYSLKPDDELGQPGSESRNPIIADIFHEINLAEQKGSGIRRMRELMEGAHLAVPTFESNRAANKFTARLLLHHFLGEEDLKWLESFSGFDFDDDQKKALIFLREAQAVNNLVFRQLAGCDTIHATAALRKMRDCGILVQRGKSTATYYKPGEAYLKCVATKEGRGGTLTAGGETLTADGETLTVDGEILTEEGRTMECLKVLKGRMNKNDLRNLIVGLCVIKPRGVLELSRLLKRNETYLQTILKGMITEKMLSYTYPMMPTHPNQAYTIPEGRSCGGER